MKAKRPKAIDIASLLIVIIGIGWLATGAIGRLFVTDPASDATPMSLTAFSGLLTDGHWLGPENAPVVMIIYSTYACGFCAEFQHTVDEIRQRYPQHVSAYVKQYVKPVRGAELDVALGAECAAAVGRFASYHHAAFAHGDQVQSADSWKRIGAAADIQPVATFRECVRSQKYVRVIESIYREGEALNIVGTPTVFINGSRLNGTTPLSFVDSLVARYLSRT